MHRAVQVFVLFFAASAANNAENHNCLKYGPNLAPPPTSCCLTGVCSDGNLFERLMDYPPASRELYCERCRDKVQLTREFLAGCAGDPTSGINRNTNFDVPVLSAGKVSIVEVIQRATEVCGMNFARTGNRSQLDKFTTLAPAGAAGADDRKIGSDNVTEEQASSRISGLQFLDVPRGDEMRIHDLTLDDDYFLFELLSRLIDYMHPGEFPAGLMREAVQNQIPFHEFAFQLLKTEISVVGWILFWALLTLFLPLAVWAHFCCSNGALRRLSEDGSDVVSLDYRERWTVRTTTFLLHLFLVLMLIPIICILAGNEQISKYLSRSTSMTNTIFEDVNTFIKNTHMQISFVATSSTDITVEAIRKDLDNISKLLGRPYQQDLANETGLDVALDSLVDLKQSTGEITWLLTEVLKECRLARAAGSLLQEQLTEIARQLTIARQQCLPKDRALCYTLQYSGLDVTFSCTNLTADLKIKQLERIGSEMAFNKSVDEARIAFEEIPGLVCSHTAANIAEIKSILNRKRTEVYKSAHSLDELTRSVLDSTLSTHERSLKFVESISEWDLVVWAAILGICTVLSLIWGLLLCGAPCGYPGSASRTVRFLQAGMGLASVVCVALWCLGTAAFLVGGHGQSLLCRPLYDQPRYGALGQLLNSDGVLYANDSFFRAFVKGGGEPLNAEDVLRSCQRDRPTYSTFHLNNFFDVQSLTNYKSWPDFKSVIANMTIRDGGPEILSPSLQLHLQALATTSTVNLTKYRSEILAPLTRRDLNSFVDQLSAVSRQLHDLGSATKIDHLATMLKKVARNELQRLSDLRDSILFKITALEVLIQPLSRQANHSLARLKGAQYFLDNQARLVADRNTNRFAARIEAYLEDLHNHTNVLIKKEIGKCQPLWEIFHKSRYCICKLIINPLNGVSFSSYFLIFLFAAILPVILKVKERFREADDDAFTSITHRRARDGLMIDEECTWATPSLETPPDVEMRSREQQTEPEVWVSPVPSRPSEFRIPPPPLLSTIASRISAARVPQIPTVSRARSPKRTRENLYLVEPISWKSGSLSPRSWI